MTVAEYDKCVHTLSDNLYRFALKSLRDEELAKDIVQESFLRLWENREAVLDGKEKSYLFTIAYRLIIDQARYKNDTPATNLSASAPMTKAIHTAESQKPSNAIWINCPKFNGL